MLVMRLEGETDLSFTVSSPVNVNFLLKDLGFFPLAVGFLGALDSESRLRGDDSSD